MRWRLTPEYGGGRSFMTVLFVLWGLGGFIVIVLGMAGSSAIAGALLGAAGGILWIGGMVFLGIGALLASPNYSMSDVLHTGSYKGVKYRQMADYSIQMDTEDGPVTYPDMKSFRNDVKARR